MMNKIDYDMLDRAHLMEYSTEFNNNQNKENNSFSNLNDSVSNTTEKETGDINIREYENIVLKIDNISIIEEKTLKILKENLIYIECKVPLFKSEQKNDEESQNIFYDTFKYYIKIKNRIYNKVQSSDNIFKLDHVSYHKIKLGEDNFSALTSAKIEFFIHYINLKKNKEDVIIGKGSVDFNRLILAKDFFLNLNLEILNHIEKPKEREQDKEKNPKNLKKIPTKKIGR